MTDSLPRYLQMKIHQLIPSRTWDKIVVEGLHSRGGDSVLFQGEKRGKPFNWQRPTARVVRETRYGRPSELRIQCFPGNDHVRHYAELIAAHLGLATSDGLTPAENVVFEPPGPTATADALMATNLRRMPRCDTVVLGLVHRLPRLTGLNFAEPTSPGSSGSWSQGIGDDFDAFEWSARTINGRRVGFLGFRPSFWGDISATLVTLLAERFGVRQILYFGKLGSLQSGVRPNRFLATGTASLVEGTEVRWPNALDDALQSLEPAKVPKLPLIHGRHVTVPSVLYETKEWLASLGGEGVNERRCDFVDPEVGVMAKAARETGTEFGYLHLISDNVREKYDEDLSNERKASVLSGRDVMYGLVQDVFEYHLTRQ